MPDRGWTIADVARFLGVSEKTVRRRIDRGELPAYRVARGRNYIWLVDPAALGARSEPEPAAAGGVAGEAAAGLAVSQPLIELLREKDRQILDLADQLGAARERIRLLEAAIRAPDGISVPDNRRSWMRRFLG